MHLLVLLQPQCTHTHMQLLLLATVLVFHSLTAFVPQVQTSHAALGLIVPQVQIAMLLWD